MPCDVAEFGLRSAATRFEADCCVVERPVPELMSAQSWLTSHLVKNEQVLIPFMRREKKPVQGRKFHPATSFSTVFVVLNSLLHLELQYCSTLPSDIPSGILTVIGTTPLTPSNCP